MTPYSVGAFGLWVVVDVVALVGLAGWGVRGALLGGALAWGVSMAIGLASYLIERGVLPRRVREESVNRFLLENQHLARLAYPEFQGDALRRAVERDMEMIFQEALTGAPLGRSGLELDGVFSAAEKLYLQEGVPARRELILALLSHIRRTMYA